MSQFLRPFQNIARNKPGRSVFDLSYSKLLTCNMGELIPVMCDEVVPGDVFEIGHDMVIRFQPLVAPILHPIKVKVHSWFVPYRLLDEHWEDFITGGIDGTYEDPIPEWQPTDTTVGSLWDYLGFPTGVDPSGYYPIDYPRRAYNWVWNNCYKDETHDDDIALTNESILKCRWDKDYFTSALPWAQRGIAPALPVTGSLSAVFASDIDGLYIHSNNNSDSNTRVRSDGGYSPDPSRAIYNLETSGLVSLYSDSLWQTDDISATDLSANTVNLAGAQTFDVNDIRLTYQTQRWLELNARGGARYTEFLRAHYDVAPRDDRLDRPEYIGGSTTPVIISEVLQTSSTDTTTPQGNMSGHGISVGRQRLGTYRVKEHGLIITLMSVRPDAAYSQGINRQWLRKTKFDFYFPEFAHLGEQEIRQAEIYANGVYEDNHAIFGYQGRFDEMRVKPNLIAGQMRSDLNYWHLGRIFGSAPALNSTFLEMDSTDFSRVFAVTNEDQMIINYSNIIRAIRPIPALSQPGW